MSEVNERDLEQAAGGAEFDDVQKKWYNLNCHRCTNIVASCSPTKITAQMNIARGEGYTYPPQALNEDEGGRIMSEKFENHEINEQELEQVAGGASKNKTFFYCCSKCGATKVIAGNPFPAKTPICCGAPMELKGYS